MTTNPRNIEPENTAKNNDLVKQFSQVPVEWTCLNNENLPKNIIFKQQQYKEYCAVVLELFQLFNPPQADILHSVPSHHRRRIKTEEKAKVVTFGWWIYEYLNVELTIFPKHTFSKQPLFCYPLFQGKEFNQFCPPTSSGDLCLLFCLYPHSI